MSYYSYNEQARGAAIDREFAHSQSVALFQIRNAGISDPAFHVVQQALKNGIPLIPIPGPTAFISALITSGLPTDRFVFEGFLPLKKGRKTKFESLKSESRTIIIYGITASHYQNTHRIQTYLGTRHVVVARELTKKFEEIVRGNIQSLFLRSVKSSLAVNMFVVIQVHLAKQEVTKQ